MKRFSVYKMMIQSTILQNSSINAVPDHFIKAIVASECILSSVFLFFGTFEDLLFFDSCLFAFLQCSQAKLFQELSFEFPRCFPSISPVFPSVSLNKSGFWCL